MAPAPFETPASAPIKNSKKIKCNVDGQLGEEWQFSKTNWRKALRGHAVPCRLHSGQPVEEHRCRGPCNLVKPLNGFSKSTRTKDIYWCKECVAWSESQVPGFTPWAPPNHELAEDESYQMSLVERQKALAKVDRAQSGAAKARGRDLSQALSQLEIDLDNGSTTWAPRPSEPDLEECSNIGSSASARIAQPAKLTSSSLFSESVAGGLRHTSGVASNFAPSESGTGVEPSISGLAPHNPAPSDISEATTMQQARIAYQEANKKSYNAWDSSGRIHRVAKALTIQSGRSVDGDDELSSLSPLPPLRVAEKGSRAVFGRASDSKLPEVPIRVSTEKKAYYSYHNESDDSE